MQQRCREGRRSDLLRHFELVLTVGKGENDSVRGQGRVSHAPLLLWPREYIDPGAPGVRSVITKAAMFRLKGACTCTTIRCPSVGDDSFCPPWPPTMEYHRVWTRAASALPAVSLIHPESRRFHLPCLFFFPPICPGCSVFLHSWHSQQNKIYRLVFCLAFSDSAHKSARTFHFYYVVITCLSGPCFDLIQHAFICWLSLVVLLFTCRCRAFSHMMLWCSSDLQPVSVWLIWQRF